MHDPDTEELANIRRFSRFQRLLHDIEDAETEAQAHCRLEWALQQLLAERHHRGIDGMRGAAW